MVLPYYLLDTVEAFIKHSHRFVPLSIQIVLSQFIEKNYLYTHVKKVIEVAEERKRVFTDTFEECFGESVLIKQSQTRSLHVLAELDKCIKDTDVVQHFAKNNIIAHAYSKCFVDETKKQGLILGYTPVRTLKMKQKIVQMERLYRLK
jgi:GntR family transcriptional regulator/MocR family aminotransferase